MCLKSWSENFTRFVKMSSRAMRKLHGDSMLNQLQVPSSSSEDDDHDDVSDNRGGSSVPINPFDLVS